MVAGIQQPPVGAVLAFPVVDAAVGDDGRARLRRMRPDLGAGGRIQSDDGIVAGEDIHHAVCDQRIEEVFVVVAGGINPGDFEFAHIGAIDLRQRGILG